jgi:hypothetical protein
MDFAAYFPCCIATCATPGTLVRAADVSGKCLADPTVISLLANTVLPRPHLKAVFFHEADQLLDDEKQVTLHQTDRNGCTHSGENTNAALQPFVVLAEAKLRDRGIGFNCIHGLHQVSDVDTVNNFQHSVAPSAFGLTASACDIRMLN